MMIIIFIRWCGHLPNLTSDILYLTISLPSIYLFIYLFLYTEIPSSTLICVYFVLFHTGYHYNLSNWIPKLYHVDLKPFKVFKMTSDFLSIVLWWLDVIIIYVLVRNVYFIIFYSLVKLCYFKFNYHGLSHQQSIGCP